MKTKLIITTDLKSFEFWTNIPFIPRNNEYFNLRDILTENEIENIKKSAHQWDGIRGVVQTVEYRHDDNDFFSEIVLFCEN